MRQLIRRRRGLLAVGPSRLDRALSRMQEQAGVHAVERVEAVLELGDDAEVAAAAAQPPEQLRPLRLAGADDRAVGEDDFAPMRLSQARPCRAHQVAQPATEGQPGDPGHRDRAAGGRQPVRLGGGVEVSPGGAAPGARDAPLPDRPAPGSSRTGRSPVRRRPRRDRRRCARRRARRWRGRARGRSAPPPRRPPSSGRGRSPPGGGRSSRSRRAAPRRSAHHRAGSRSPLMASSDQGREENASLCCAVAMSASSNAVELPVTGLYREVKMDHGSRWSTRTQGDLAPHADTVEGP